MYNLPGLMFDDNKDVDQPECCGYDDTEITGQNDSGVIANEGRPALIAARASLWAFLAYIFVQYVVIRGHLV